MKCLFYEREEHNGILGLLRHLHLTEQILLLIVEICRQLHFVGDNQVAVCAVTSVITLVTYAHLRIVLRFWLYSQFDFLAIIELNDDLSTEQRRIEIDIDIGIHLTAACPHSATTRRGMNTSHIAKEILEEAGEASTTAKLREVKIVEW